MAYAETKFIPDIYEYHSFWGSSLLSTVLQTLILALGPVLEPEGPVPYYKPEHSTLTSALLLLHSALLNTHVTGALKTFIL